MSLITIDTTCPPCPRSTRWVYTNVPVPPGPAVLVVAANPARRKVILQNSSGMTSCNIGPTSAVTPVFGTGGFPIPADAPPAPINPLGRIELETTAEIWAASAGAALEVIEILD